MIQILLKIFLTLMIFMGIGLFFFLKNRKARLLLLSLLPVMLIICGSLLRSSHLPGYVISALIFTGMISFPFTLALLTLAYFPVDNSTFIVKSVIIALPVILLFFIIPERRYPLICLLHMAIYTHLLISLKGKLLIKFHLTFVLILPLLYLFFHYLFLKNDYLIIFSIIFVYIITFYMVLFEYSRKLSIIQERMNSLIMTNNKLNQGITRLRQNNDQLVKIISQKDIELLQVARHASLAEITTGIAHELAQPLTGIKCISQNMIDDINYDEMDRMQAVSDLTRISLLVDRSSSIIDHIRTFSRKRGFSFTKLDLNSCIMNAVDLVNNQIKNSNTDIIFKLDESIPAVHGDNLSLEQLFINLVLNSRDAIKSKQEINIDYQGIIKITTEFNGSNVLLTIEDNGSGIPQDILPRIWTPFFTTKQKGKGTGIGLSLSHRIIKEHGAEVDIISSEEGTRFSLSFSAITESGEIRYN